MFQRSRDELSKLSKESLQDADGRYSPRKIILMFGFFAICLFMWKLILTNALTLDYLIAFMTFISGHDLISKQIDNKKPKE